MMPGERTPGGPKLGNWGLAFVLITSCLGLLPSGDAGALEYTKDTRLSSVDAAFAGEGPDDFSGNSTAIADDVNGDGFDDLLIGAPSKAIISPDGPGPGKTYLVFGRASGWNTSASLNDASASFIGETIGDGLGSCVRGVGDVNGDGFGDILLSAPYNGWNGINTGQTYLIFGKPGGWARDTNISSASASFVGENVNDVSGLSVAGAGDVNCDGYDDIIIGAHGYDDGGVEKGKVYIFLGRPSGWSLRTNLSAADASFIGERELSWFGGCVAGAGDVNGDGYDDIIMGAYNDVEGGGDRWTLTGAGQAYLVFGKPGGWAKNVPIANAAGASFIGEDIADYAGFSVAGAGDFNRDGYDDIIISAPNNDEAGGNSLAASGAGEAYLVPGKASGWAMDTKLSSCPLSFRGERGGDTLGLPVTRSGDSNGDGYSDILIAAILNDDGGASAGKLYLVLGNSSGWSPDLNISCAQSSFTGENAFDIAGYSISGGGDLNLDGVDDIVVSAPNHQSAAPLAGATYVIFAQKNSLPDATSLRAYSDPGCTNETFNVSENGTVHIELRGGDSSPSRKEVAIVRVSSNLTFPAGIRVRLYETAESSGTYRGKISLAGRTDEEDFLIAARLGETVTITPVNDPGRKLTLLVGYDQLRLDNLTASRLAVRQGNVVNLTAILGNDGVRGLQGVTVGFQWMTVNNPGNATTFETRILDLGKGARASVSVDWNTSGKTGEFILRAVVDHSNVIREANENDNAAQVLCNVTGPAVLSVRTERPVYERKEIIGVNIESSVSGEEHSVKFLFPDGSSLTDTSVTTNASGRASLQVAIDIAHPLGKYIVRLSYDVDDASTTFDVVNEQPAVSSPPDLEYLTGTIGHYLNWSCNDISPANFSISRNGLLERGGPWNGSNISISIDGLPSGTYDYSLTLYDIPGNRVSDAVKVTVRTNLPPVVSIHAPLNNTAVSGNVAVRGAAMDPDGHLTAVEFRVDDGNWTGIANALNWSFSYDTRNLADGRHALYVRARDNDGVGSIVGVTLEFANRPNRPPVVTITSPARNAIISGMSAIRGTASDPDGDSLTVQYRVDDGPWVNVVPVPGWTFNWTPAANYSGKYTVTVRASDEHGAFSDDSRVLRVLGGGTEPAPTVDAPPYTQPAVLVSIPTIVVIGAGAALATTDVGRWAIFKLIFLAGFTKRRDEKVLDNFIRGWIQGVVVRDPGVRPVDVVDTFEGQYSTNLIYYHINELIRHGFMYMVQRNRNGEIDSVRKGSDNRVVELDTATWQEKETDLTLRNSTVHSMSLQLYPSDIVAPKSQISIRKKQRFMIYRHIAEHPGVTQGEMSEALDLIRQAVAYHINELQEDGLLIVSHDGRNKYYFINKEKNVDLRENFKLAEPARDESGTISGTV